MEQTEVNRTHETNVDITLKEVVLDVLVSSVLITGVWFTNALGDLFFPEGIPFFDSILIYARNVISTLWAVRMIVRYSTSTYNEINSAIINIIGSPVWISARELVIGNIKYLWKLWRNTKGFYHILTITISITVMLFILQYFVTRFLVDLWLILSFITIIFFCNYVFKIDILGSQLSARYYRFTIIFTFCIIQICIGIGIIDILYMRNTNILSEVRHVIISLFTTPLNFSDTVRILFAMGTLWAYPYIDKYYLGHSDRINIQDRLPDY